MGRLIILCLVCILGPSAYAETPACTMCHSSTGFTSTGSPHSEGDCTACHGAGDAHVSAPGTPGSILSFTTQSASERSEVCKACHSADHTGVQIRSHASVGVACNDCHSIHEQKTQRLPAGFERTPETSRVCATCHEDTFAQFAMSERHRLAEGSISCTDCHEPHEGSPTSQLGGFSQATCAGCHADTAGPFVFEHAASRVEGCQACHAPHGSPNRHMLTHQRPGELCYSCHAIVPQFHLGFNPSGAPAFNEDTACTNCHVAIHGSNLDRNLLR